MRHPFLAAVAATFILGSIATGVIAQSPPAASRFPIAADRDRAEWLPRLTADVKRHGRFALDVESATFVVWLEGLSGPSVIRTQRLLDDGRSDPGWPERGFPLPGSTRGSPAAFTSDGAGGFFLAWVDSSSSLQLDHLEDSRGRGPLWTSRTELSRTPVLGSFRSFAMQPDGRGGVFVAWLDARAGKEEEDVYAQHVLASGRIDPTWPGQALAVCAEPSHQLQVTMATDAANGFYVAWVDSRASGDLDVYVQHVLGHGRRDPRWPEGGAGFAKSQGSQFNPRLLTDDRDGVLLFWQDRSNNDPRAAALRVTCLGAPDPRWPVSGMRLGDGQRRGVFIDAVPDGDGGALITWNEIPGGPVAQHMSDLALPELDWGASGVAMGATKGSDPKIAADGAGGAFVIWNDHRNNSFNSDVYAHHVLADGRLDPAWPATGSPIAIGPVVQIDPVIQASGHGAIAVWEEAYDIFGTRFERPSLTRSLLPIVPGAGPLPDLGLSPEPAQRSVEISFAAPDAGKLSLHIHDLAGRRIRSFVEGARASGTQSLRWDLRDERGVPVAPGIYLVVAEAGTWRQSRRITVLP